MDGRILLTAFQLIALQPVSIAHISLGSLERMSKFVENFEKSNARVNNVEFCKVCGSILDIPESGNIECGICHWTCHLSGEMHASSLSTRFE